MADAISGKSSYPFLTAEEYFRQFQVSASSANAHTMILSAEHFFGGQPRLWDNPSPDEYVSTYRRKIEKLAEFTSQHDVELVVYLRPQVDWLSSTINQNIKIDRLASSRRIYRSDEQFFNMFKPALLYSNTLSHWEEVIKPSAIHVRNYSKEALVGRNSIIDFVSTTGLSSLALPPPKGKKLVNESLTREYIELKKIINRVPRTKEKERLIIHCLKKLSSLSNESTTYRLKPATEQALKEFVADDNIRLSERYLSSGSSFTSVGSYVGASLEDISVDQIKEAKDNFRSEMSRLDTRIKEADIVLRAFLRENVQPLHAILHRAKTIIHH